MNRRGFLLASLFLTCAVSLPAQKRTALDEYVAAPDENYRYELVNTAQGGGVTAYIIEMTSQAWRKPSEVDNPLWKHVLTVIRPDTVKTDTALLFIDGGSNDGRRPAAADPRMAKIATETQSVVAHLRQVPNQPLTFTSDPFRRQLREDALIAYGMRKYLETADPLWVLRLPMTKSAVKAMDTTIDFLGKQDGGPKVSKFVVSGGSKRGWTTWTTAAVDKRVTAIMPMVIDVLNNEVSMRHHWRAYGFFAPAVGDYIELLTTEMGNPRLKEIARIEDPYEYRDRLTMPKYIVNAAGDQFFVSDSSQFYWNDLKGEKYLRYIANADHGMRDTDVLETLIAFYQSVIDKKPRPRFDWTFEKDGSIRVKVLDKPTEVKLWQASNPLARDFRKERIGPNGYKASALEPQAGGEYFASVPKPERGWSAFFVELTFDSGTKYPYKFTTGIRVTPDALPFADLKRK
ncbi:MAG: PhoPQ-activated pathogenicity-related family protein [Bryobacteraceae bacterium]|nr:PhoPQ-activated pathogenicity-related family protein [Bryobacteraceae bacterium]